MYDESGVSLPQYVSDQSARRLPVIAAGDAKAQDTLANDEDAYAVDIRINNRTQDSPFREVPQATVIEITDAPRGYVMFRRVHPLPGGRTLRRPQVTLLQAITSTSKID